MQSEPSWVGKAIAGSASGILFVVLVVHAQGGCDRRASETPPPQSEPQPPPPPAKVPSPEPKLAEEPATKKSGLYEMKGPTTADPYLGSSKSDPDIWRPRTERPATQEAKSK